MEWLDASSLFGGQLIQCPVQLMTHDLQTDCDEQILVTTSNSKSITRLRIIATENVNKVNSSAVSRLHSVSSVLCFFPFREILSAALYNMGLVSLKES